ncbi:Proteasome subunit beta type-7 [Lodderomyces elongisporus]|uniref:Proteasome subunit beta n=1 Tax=Lodderomyces elongisporus (strain ATCC 11503 / CBS 2605 / JCM 1781 / NBRC 1676 / NRRL YB-4239) TaxID=379508 RepID=A5E3C2_LODEL|nr:Proteasome subunit beta type-7 [Lodderomyces elongisporus]EDK45930.1 proteasome component PRE4 [Lodderomyces elongisporus NRRL YB-4239]WLF81131.1 Proteasome subunit beta type-7 [Lodderomyces elongisporus]
MNHDPFQWGRPSNDTYGPYNHRIAQANNAEFIDHSNTSLHSAFPKMNTQQPIITGTSVIASKFSNGIIMAADHVGSYGSLLRFNNIQRLIRVGSETVVGISGDISDLQYIERLLDELEIEEEVYDNEADGANAFLRAPNVHEYLSRVMYNRRSKMNPLWNSIVVGGFDSERKPFLKYVDLLGVTYHASTIATGFGSHLAIPLLRQLIPEDKDYVKVNETEARKVVDDCMRVLFYRDARSGEQFSRVVITFDDEKSGNDKINFEFVKDVKVENQSWRFAQDIRGYASKQQ